MTYELRERLQFHAQFLRTVSAYFASSEDISAEEWSGYAARTDAYRHLPGMVGYGYAPGLPATVACALSWRKSTGGTVTPLFASSRRPKAGPCSGRLILPPEAWSCARGFDFYSGVRRGGIDFRYPS